MCEKDYVWYPATYNCENKEKHLASIMNDSVIMFDEVLESYDEESVKMSLKDVHIKNIYTFLMMLYIQKILIQIILK